MFDSMLISKQEGKYFRTSCFSLKNLYSKSKTQSRFTNKA